MGLPCAERASTAAGFCMSSDLHWGFTFPSSVSRSFVCLEMGVEQTWIPFQCIIIFLLNNCSCDDVAAIFPAAQVASSLRTSPFPSSLSLPLFTGYTHPASATTPNSEYFRPLCAWDHHPFPKDRNCSTRKAFPPNHPLLGGKESRGC